MPDMPQAAAIPLRDGRICMITSRRKARWVIPKGRIERGQTPQQAAQVEVWEEAGLIGTLRPTSVGTYRYQKMDRWHTVTVFILDVTLEHPTWPEHRERKREWLTLDEAIQRVEEPDLQAILQNLVVPDSLPQYTTP